MENKKDFIRELEFYFNIEFTEYMKDKVYDMIEDYLNNKYKVEGMTSSSKFISELELFLDNKFNEYTQNRIHGLLQKYFHPIIINKR